MKMQIKKTKTAVADAWPNLNDSNADLNILILTTLVAFTGPPCVKSHMSVKCFNHHTVSKTSVTNRIGLIIGTVMKKKVWIFDAPSKFAAS